MPVITDHKANGNGLPPKPEERWKYIKELENRQVTVPTPSEPTSGGEVQSHTQLTDEQRQLLEQMQADMRQQPTQLNEVPWNEQTPAQRQQTLQHQQQVQQYQHQQQVQQFQRQQQQVQQRQQQVQQPRQQIQEQHTQRQQQQNTQQQSQPAPVTREPTAQPKTQDTAKTKPAEKRHRNAGWCSAVRSREQNRLNPCVLPWRSKVLKVASPPAAAGTVWWSGPLKIGPVPTVR